MLAQRAEREEARHFVVEGTLGVAAALDAGAPVEALFAGPGADKAVVDDARARGVPVYDLEAGVLEKVSDTVTPQPVAATVAFLDQPFECLRDATFVVVCAAISDPGNAGTVLRSAEAFGAEGVVCTDGSVDVYNPKSVRASAGSLFCVPIVVGGDPVSVVGQLAGWGLTTVGAVAHGGDDPVTVDLTAPLALVVGNESHGLSEELEAILARRVTIPFQGRTESLNVGMAASILTFEVARQRRRA